MNTPPVTPPTLVARHLSRRLGKRWLLNDVSLTLQRGEVLGLLGHNGAGKSTTLQLLAGALRPDSGEIQIGGFDLLRQPELAKARLGFLPEHPPLYRELSVDAFLTFAARLRRMPDAAIRQALIETKQRCGLVTVGSRIIGTLSKGYQQRVGIAQAIIHQPEVIILDEPTVGLDPAQLREMRALIRELGNHHSVILSTHLLPEIESLCDRVEVMRQGTLIYSASRADLQGDGQACLEELFVEVTAEAAP